MHKSVIRMIAEEFLRDISRRLPLLRKYPAQQSASLWQFQNAPTPQLPACLAASLATLPHWEVRCSLPLASTPS